MRWIKHWEKLHREGLDSPSLEILKTLLNINLGNLLSLPFLSRYLEWMTSRRAFQHQQFCVSVVMFKMCIRLGFKQFKQWHNSICYFSLSSFPKIFQHFVQHVYWDDLFVGLPITVLISLMSDHLRANHNFMFVCPYTLHLPIMNLQSTILRNAQVLYLHRCSRGITLRSINLKIQTVTIRPFFRQMYEI